MSSSSDTRQPARRSPRVDRTGKPAFETTAFAKRRDKNRRRRDLAKASRRKNR